MIFIPFMVLLPDMMLNAVQRNLHQYPVDIGIRNTIRRRNLRAAKKIDTPLKVKEEDKNNGYEEKEKEKEKSNFPISNRA